MNLITLNNGKQVRVSAEDMERLAGFTWSQFQNGRAYRRELIPREERVGKKIYRTILLHREVMGVDDPRKVIFRDGDPGNCTRDNLVVKGPSFRPRQRVKKPGSSRYRGVGWNRSKEMWQAYIRVNGKLKHLGFFAAGEEGEQLAARAYDEAARQNFGELAVLNFPRVRRRRLVARPAQPQRAEVPALRIAPAQPPAEAPAPTVTVAPAPASDVAELYQRPVEELTPEDLEVMKARFLGERYRGRMRRAG